MDVSPMLQWASSPGGYQFDCFSPEGSNMSFTMTSPPPCQIPTYGSSSAQQCDNINSTFSPSIFSPREKLTTKFPKKRDYLKDANFGERGGIAEMAEKVSPESACESQASLDYPAVLSM
jgi:hypothetical protein